MSNYYNTTNESGRTLKDYQNKAMSQDIRIMLFFKQNDRAQLCASQVMNMVFGDRTPITSVRRSLNTLENNGVLIKAFAQRRGPYGRSEHCYKLKKLGI